MNIFDLIKQKNTDELYKYIVENENIDLDIYDEHYNYVIQYIVMYNMIDIFKYILKNRTVRLDILDTDGRNLLYNPIKYNYYEILENILEYDKNNIGVSIVDLRDNIGYIGLHYSIIFNNIKAFKLLYSLKSDVNIIDNKNNNIYIICLQYKRADLLIYLLENEIKKNNNINHFINSKGESILQNAINYDEMKVIKYIINNTMFLKQIINIKENEYGLSALHQAIVLNLNNVAIKLIKNGADINTSDYIGNTPLHYTIIEKNYMILDYIIHLPDINIYYNETNMNGNTPLHLLIEDDIIDININDIHKHKYNMCKILLKMIENTDLCIMNNNGNTIMHYIVMKNLWTLPEVKEILVNGTTHMNLFITNRDNMNVMDMLANNSLKEEFIDITVNSYYNILKKLKNSDKLVILWEKYCANEDLTNLLKIVKKTNSKQTGLTHDIAYYCKSTIRQNIVDMKSSMPTYKELNLNVITTANNLPNGCYYTGSTIDILFGLYYLNNEYNAKLILEYPLTHNKEIENYYIKMGLNYSFKMEFSNIEIVWSFMKLIYPTNFESILLSRINYTDKYIIISLGIEVSNGSHANMIIIDIKNKLIERFEPNGKYSPRGFYYNSDLLDTLLLNKFTNILPEYTYIKPLLYLPTIGFQILETIEDSLCKKIGDPNGYCAVWCVWWVEQKITNNDVSSKELVENLIRHIKLSNKSFKNLIRNYSMKIVHIRDNFLNKYDITIDDWMLRKYDDNIIASLEKDVLDKIN